jgi:hypothetical protein
MRFTLTYEGPLPSSGNKPKNEAKWEIRKKIHPQLLDLWTSHPALKAVEDNKHFPKTGGAVLAQVHHLYPGPLGVITWTNRHSDGTSFDLCEPLNKHGAWFRPLVRETYALHCGLKIRFLRKEPPGKVYQGGDLDGRMKTLIDALSMPQHVEQILEKNIGTQSDPLHCLLEDDSMISGLEIESERLLGDHPNEADFVKLTIEVDVRVRLATVYNLSFLG